jgi:23S rRNA U2552 (ribose-2'-O)-methylase RlmE/FtsJ
MVKTIKKKTSKTQKGDVVNNKKVSRDTIQQKIVKKPKEEDKKIPEIYKKPDLLEPKYYPIAIELPLIKDIIFDNDAEIKLSTNLDYSKFSLGFHYYIHANKNELNVLEQFEGKKKVYLVMNEFENIIDNYEENIDDIAKKFFDNSKISEIVNRNFYKIWELFFMFGDNIIDLKKEDFISAHLAENSASCIQAVMFFRDKYSKKNISKQDKYYAITEHIKDLEKNFIEQCEKEKPQRLLLHKDSDKVINTISNKVDFITADINFDLINENLQEQEAFQLILEQIINAVKIQKSGGSFICKFYETFTLTSLKLISILSVLYNKVYFVKPLMSRTSSSEKYAVCLGFKYTSKDKEYTNIINKLDTVFKLSQDNKSKKIVDLFSSYQIPQVLFNTMIQINTNIGNKQQKNINETVSFINAQNFYGEIYQNNHEKQIQASKFWIQHFFPDIEHYAEYIEKIKYMVDYSLQINKINIEIFNSVLY